LQGTPGDILEKLGRLAARRTVLLGMGNMLRGDDGFGPELAERVSSSGLMPAIDAGTTPENQVGAVARLEPEAVILADAVHMGSEIGTLDLLAAGDLLEASTAGTHALSPGMVMDRIAGETGAEVFMLAVQPGSLGFGQPMSDEVRKAVETAVEALERVFRPGTSNRAPS